VTAIGSRLLVVGSGLVGSSHITILWSWVCHTFASPGPKALGATPDHRGSRLVTGDVWVGQAPVGVAPNAAVRGVHREQLNTCAGGHAGKTPAEHGGGEPGHGAAEAFPACAAAHGFSASAAGISEVQVLHGDGVDVMPLGVVDQSGDRVAEVGVTAR
jgi:hypothetical protein